MLKSPLLLIALVGLAGCATPTTGVVPQNSGYLTVTRQGEGFWVSPGTLTAQARVDAAHHCKGLGKASNVIHAKEIPAGPMGRWPEAEIVFKCE